MSKSSQPTGTDPCCEAAPLLVEPLTADAAGDMAIKLKALADPVRLRLFSAVASHAGGEACVCDISAGIDVTQPTVSHHLKVLRDAGLLISERRASWVYYAVVPDALRSLSALLSISTDGGCSGEDAGMIDSATPTTDGAPADSPTPSRCPPAARRRRRRSNTS